MSNQFDVVRAYLNDRSGLVFNDEELAPFVAEATTMVPRVAAGLIALSRGNYKMAQILLRVERFDSKKKPRSKKAERRSAPIGRGTGS